MKIVLATLLVAVLVMFFVSQAQASESLEESIKRSIGNRFNKIRKKYSFPQFVGGKKFVGGSKRFGGRFGGAKRWAKKQIAKKVNKSKLGRRARRFSRWGKKAGLRRFPKFRGQADDQFFRRLRRKIGGGVKSWWKNGGSSWAKRKAMDYIKRKAYGQSDSEFFGKLKSKAKSWWKSNGKDLVKQKANEIIQKKLSKLADSEFLFKKNSKAKDQVKDALKNWWSNGGKKIVQDKAKEWVHKKVDKFSDASFFGSRKRRSGRSGRGRRVFGKAKSAFNRWFKTKGKDMLREKAREFISRKISGMSDSEVESASAWGSRRRRRRRGGFFRRVKGAAGKWWKNGGKDMVKQKAKEYLAKKLGGFMAEADNAIESDSEWFFKRRRSGGRRRRSRFWSRVRDFARNWWDNSGKDMVKDKATEWLNKKLGGSQGGEGEGQEYTGEAGEEGSVGLSDEEWSRGLKKFRSLKKGSFGKKIRGCFPGKSKAAIKKRFLKQIMKRFQAKADSQWFFKRRRSGGRRRRSRFWSRVRDFARNWWDNSGKDMVKDKATEWLNKKLGGSQGGEGEGQEYTGEAGEEGSVGLSDDEFFGSFGRKLKEKAKKEIKKNIGNKDQIKQKVIDEILKRINSKVQRDLA